MTGYYSMTGTCRAAPAVAYILYLAANSGILKMSGRLGKLPLALP